MKEDEERQHFILQLEDKMRDFVIAKRIYIYDLTPLRCITQTSDTRKTSLPSSSLTKVRKMVGKYSKSENAPAQCKVIRKCDWKDDLQLTREDLNILGKFLAGFKPIKRMSDQLNVRNTTVDLGLSSLSMHSIRDTMGCQDVIHHQHQTLHNILQAVCRPGQVLLLWLVFTLIGMYYD